MMRDERRVSFTRLVVTSRLAGRETKALCDTLTAFVERREVWSAPALRSFRAPVRSETEARTASGAGQGENQGSLA